MIRQQVARGPAERVGEQVHDEDRRRALGPFEHPDVRAVEACGDRQRLLAQLRLGGVTQLLQAGGERLAQAAGVLLGRRHPSTVEGWALWVDRLWMAFRGLSVPGGRGDAWSLARRCSRTGRRPPGSPGRVTCWPRALRTTPRGRRRGWRWRCARAGERATVTASWSTPCGPPR